MIWISSKTQLVGLLLLGLLVSSASPTYGLDLTHGDGEDHEEFPLPSMDAGDQPMVDNKVSIRTTFDRHGFVAVYEKNSSGLGEMVGMTMFMAPSGGHSHLPSLQLSDMEVYEGGATLYAHVTMPDDAVGRSFRAVLYNDTDMDGSFDMSVDNRVENSDGSELFTDFSVTESFAMVEEVENQTISADHPLVTIKKTIIPGPAWQLLHAYDNGKLGAMVSNRTQLKHGVNTNVVVDMTGMLDKLTYEPGVPFRIFAHTHYDVWETGEFNGTTDTHVFSPSFNDPILGNDSAQLFWLTIEESTDDLLMVTGVVGVLALGFIGLIVYRKRSLNS